MKNLNFLVLIFFSIIEDFECYVNKYDENVLRTPLQKLTTDVATTAK